MLSVLIEVKVRIIGRILSDCLRVLIKSILTPEDYTSSYIIKSKYKLE